MIKIVVGLAPVALGFIAGITVFFGALFIVYVGMRLSSRGIGFINGLAGGVLAYLALEAGHEAEEYGESLAKIDTLADFLVALFLTSVALIGTWMLLVWIEKGFKSSKSVYDEALIARIVASALGLHNVGEGFAIAASLLAGEVTAALLFTLGFAIHNFTEGFAIAGPFYMRGSLNMFDRSRIALILGLSLLAGLPVIPGALIYYAGISSGLFLAIFYTIATASIVYAMLHINLAALAKLGGVASPLFWISIFSGIALTYTSESLILFTLSP